MRASALYEEHGEKLRYLVVGVCNTTAGYGLFILLLVVLGRPLQALAGSPVAALSFLGRQYYLIVQWVTWVCMVPVSTTTMKYLAFRSAGRLGPQIVRGYMVYLPAQGISTVLLWATVSLLKLPPQIGQLVAIAVATVFSYIGHKYFTFRVPLEVGEVPDRDLIEKA